MTLRHLWVVALSFSLSSAFKDTSPFFLFSTSELLISSPGLVTAGSLQQSVGSLLQKCPSDVYVIVSQPGVNAVDFHSAKAAPNLGRRVRGEDKDVRSSLVVQDVKGTVSSAELKDLLQSKCSAEQAKLDASTGTIPIVDESNPRVFDLDFPPLPTGSGRIAAIAEHDEILERALDLLHSEKYTVIYATTPSNAESYRTHAEPEPYEMESTFNGLSHLELKRDLRSYKRQSNNDSLPEGPLFERYQFLSPGIFMGLVAGIILLSILYVAISGLSSLEITYAAFDKEVGPAAQKSKAQ